MGQEVSDTPYMTSEVVRVVGTMKVVPTFGHGAQVEWHINGSDVEVTFDSRGNVIGVSWDRA